MSRKSETDIGQTLRATDPASRLAEPTAGETAAMRRRVLAATREPTTLRFLAPALAGSAAALLVGLGLSKIAAPPPAAEEAVARALRSVREAREIQFTTPGGTLVVWTLDPEFDL